jgi:acyl-CoA thioesterase FadM
MVPHARRCYLSSVTNAVREFSLALPRNAFTPREVPRAGDIWRLCQDTATLASIDSGWPPARFRREKVAFIVYRMTLLHEMQTAYGTQLHAKTWVSRLRRRTLCTREVRIRAAGSLVAAATQEWVHVDFDTMKPKQGSLEAAAAFPEIDVEPSVSMPELLADEGAEDEFRFQMWQTWADPLAHANHPAYVDWCDEATSRRMHSAGLDPVLLRPIAGQVTFRNAVLPGEEVVVRTKRVGMLGEDGVVLEHQLETARGVAAEATTVRGLQEGSVDALVSAWS